MAGVVGKTKAIFASTGAKVRSPAPPAAAPSAAEQDAAAAHGATEAETEAEAGLTRLDTCCLETLPPVAGSDGHTDVLVSRISVPDASSQRASTRMDHTRAGTPAAACNDLHTHGATAGQRNATTSSAAPLLVPYRLSPQTQTGNDKPAGRRPAMDVYAAVRTLPAASGREHAHETGSPPSSPSTSSALFTAARAPASEPPWVSLPKDVFAGSLAGMATTVVGQPLDTIKTRFQAGVKHGGVWHTAKAMARNEGAASFFRGMSSPLWFSAAYAGAYYASYLQARSLLGIADRSQQAPMSKMLAATIITGACTTVVRGPMDLLKSRIQIKAVRRPTERPYNAMTYGINYVRTQGTMALFAGFVPTLLRQMLGATMWFIPYELMKSHYGTSASSVFICGGLASWTYWGSVYPLDTIKTRMQSDHPSPARRQYHGMLDCASKMIRYEGWQSLFRGFVPCMLRAFPSNAAGILAYEYARALVSADVDSGLD